MQHKQPSAGNNCSMRKVGQGSGQQTNKAAAVGCLLHLQPLHTSGLDPSCNLRSSRWAETQEQPLCCLLTGGGSQALPAEAGTSAQGDFIPDPKPSPTEFLFLAFRKGFYLFPDGFFSSPLMYKYAQQEASRAKGRQPTQLPSLSFTPSCPLTASPALWSWLGFSSPPPAPTSEPPSSSPTASHCLLLSRSTSGFAAAAVRSSWTGQWVGGGKRRGGKVLPQASNSNSKYWGSK